MSTNPPTPPTPPTDSLSPGQQTQVAATVQDELGTFLKREGLNVVNLTNGSRNGVVVLACLFILLAVLALSDAIVQATTGHQDPTITLILRLLLGIASGGGGALMLKIFRRGGLG